MTNLLTEKRKKYYFISLLFIAFFAQTKTGLAQSVSLGADFVNRYIWRGYDFGHSASVQPHIEFAISGFTLGTWANYAISPVKSGNFADALGASEHDLYASYNFGLISVGVTDYYFPTGSDLFNYHGVKKNADGVDVATGAHIIEPNISITGGNAFPITLYAAINAYNDPNNSVYLQASIPFSVGETDLSFTAGGVPTSSNGDNPGYYTNSKAAVTNLNITAGRAIKISDSFSLPITASYILNPYENQSYLLFGLCL